MQYTVDPNASPVGRYAIGYARAFGTKGLMSRMGANLARAGTMFGRREKQTFFQAIRGQLWPRRGFRRVGRYIVARLYRLKRTPHSIAAGFAAGAAASFTPLLGLHFVLGFMLAFFTRGSMIAAALGTAIGNPFTFPLIFAGTYWTGKRIFQLVGVDEGEAVPGVVSETAGGALDAESEAAADAVMAAAEHLVERGWDFSIVSPVWPVFETMLVGSLPLAVIAYIGFYFVLRNAIATLARRRARRTARLQSQETGNI